jgi:hypothetical protein
VGQNRRHVIAAPEGDGTEIVRKDASDVLTMLLCAPRERGMEIFDAMNVMCLNLQKEYEVISFYDTFYVRLFLKNVPFPFRKEIPLNAERVNSGIRICLVTEL